MKFNLFKKLSSKIIDDKYKFEKDSENFYHTLSDEQKIKVFHHIIRVIYRNKIHLKIDNINCVIYDLQLNNSYKNKILDSGILEIVNSIDFCNNFENLLQESINNLTTKDINNYDILLSKNLYDNMKKLHLEKLNQSKYCEK